MNLFILLGVACIVMLIFVMIIKLFDDINHEILSAVCIGALVIVLLVVGLPLFYYS